MSAMSEEQDWRDELDALKAAPRHHTLLFENEMVRVLDTTVPPRDTVPLHTHQWPAAQYILTWSHFVRRDGEGFTMVDSRIAASLQTASRSGLVRCRPTHWKTSARRSSGPSLWS